MPKTYEEMAAYKHAWYLEHRESHLARCKVYCQDNKEQISLQRKAYRKINHELIRQGAKTFYGNNKERVLSGNKRWVAAHPEEDKRMHKEYYQVHREEICARTREYSQTHREEIAIRVREYNKNNPDKHNIASAKRRALKRNAYGSFTTKDWESIKNMYGNKCLACGCEGKLTADHVIPLAKSGSNDISNIQPLCHSCNCSKMTKTIDYRPAYYWADWT
jgi:5-methylcytosine-specific restriction endonuclease McrA